jgi:hypothetical protein
MNLQTRLIVLFVGTTLAGCSSSDSVLPVTGRVTFNGEPLAKASIRFMPMAPPDSIEAPGPGSTGLTDENGNYSLSIVGTKNAGAIVGSHRVAIYTVFSSAGRGDAPGQKEIVPAKYNSATELRFTVKASGPNVANWELESQ